jgi:replicative DNA helicase
MPPKNTNAARPPKSPKKSDAQVQALKIPPHSVEAEQSVIGGLLMDNRAWDVVSDRLAEADFYKQEHRTLFLAITELAARQHPFDLLTVTEILKTRNSLESIGGEAYLYELAGRVPSVANITAYADIVRERAVMRRLINAAQDIADAAFNPEHRSSAELLDEAESKIFAITEEGFHRAEPTKSSQVMAKTFERLTELQHSSNHITGVGSGFRDLDKMTSGWQRGDLIIIAARPSMGKTAFAMNLAEDVVIRQKKPALVFSMEMSNEQLALRLISSLGRVDQYKVRTAKMSQQEWSQVGSTISLFSQAPLYLDDTPGLSPSEVRSRARRLMRQCGGELGLIVIDYLQLMHVPGSNENRTQEVSQISRSLKGLARELKVPVIALSQLNRSLEQRAERRPVMSDLRESGSIEQDADVIGFIYRDEVYNEKTTDRGIAEIIISKHRNGPIGKVKLKFFGEFTRFEDIEEGVYMMEADQASGARPIRTNVEPNYPQRNIRAPSEYMDEE